MELVAREQPYWVIQPLVDAGLDVEQIRTLLFRLAFEAMVGGGRGVEAEVANAVLDKPQEVRAAWVETVGRMLAHAPAE
ncbi:hypothetical protein [Blastococcus sp. CT_GayMR16]|uniref:hypothetical protein n=1 Tax=Blastococcus sp. CT_GayMR16 TaxID=2559607 RepID=UPI0010743603|nr:hypothetical protein [Blastococcus sp. CT_GayMR16]TFV91064.1 hypothetical protein E4P38_00105 [Blastococcus sp. CT_GayMR16]